MNPWRGSAGSIRGIPSALPFRPKKKKLRFFDYKVDFFFPSICHRFLLINPPFLFSTFVRRETCKSGLMKLISVSIGQQTQKVHISVIHSKSHLASHLKRNPSGRLKALWKGPCPHVPPPPPLHQWLLYLIEIETSIKIGLLRGTKASDIPQWRILLWVKPLDLITLIFHLRKRNSIGASNYSQVGFAPFPTSYWNIFVLPCPQLCLTNLARVCYVRYVPQSDTVCLRAVALASWRDGGITVAKKMCPSLSPCLFIATWPISLFVWLCVGNVCLCYGY